MMSRDGLGPNSAAATAAAKLAAGVEDEFAYLDRASTPAAAAAAAEREREASGGPKLPPSHITARTLVTTGDHPGARAFHSASLVGNFVVVYGGSRGRHAMETTRVLDVRKNIWSEPEEKGRGPGPLCGHTSTGRGYSLLIYGGSQTPPAPGQPHAATRCSGELFVLDCTGMFFPVRLYWLPSIVGLRLFALSCLPSAVCPQLFALLN
jgi:hypothetical protein